MPGVPSSGSELGLASYIKSLRDDDSESSVQRLISLLQRRQIRQSRPCAVATTRLFLKLIAESKFDNLPDLIASVKVTGRQLSVAQPKEIAPGNIARRVLGLIREISEPSPEKAVIGQTTQQDSRQQQSKSSKRKSIDTSAESISMKDLKDDILNGLRELIDELDQADEQIAGYSNEYIHADEIILTYTSSLTVQKFLLQSAKRRKFTVFYVEGYPNEHQATHDTILNGRKKNDIDTAEQDGRLKTLTAAGITVVIIPDSAVYAVMSRINKVILSAHAVFSNGGLIAAAGANMITMAARAYKVPTIVLSPIFKLSPIFPPDPEEFIEMGDSGKIVDFRDGKLAQDINVVNAMSDYISPKSIDLIVTNIGGFDPSYIYRIVADHYRQEDTII